MILCSPLVSLSGRIVLSAPTEADDEAVTILDNDPASTAGLDRGHPSTTHRRGRRSNLHNLEYSHPAQARRKPEFVGVTKIYRMDRYYGNSCEFGLIMSSKHFGRGLGRDALHAVFAYVFEELKFHRLMFRTTPGHMVIRSWLDRLGATLEGIERDGSWDGNGAKRIKKRTKPPPLSGISFRDAAYVWGASGESISSAWHKKETTEDSEHTSHKDVPTHAAACRLTHPGRERSCMLKQRQRGGKSRLRTYIVMTVFPTLELLVRRSGAGGSYCSLRKTRRKTGIQEDWGHTRKPTALLMEGFLKRANESDEERRCTALT
ncbi:hypothetical protein B0H13DRAFT_1875123 [Mycena leptocephala]|nr:hypothetical protein B0H13DRAFT_1875123 [Mycena leptocephala]